jgi:hypothetical protein
MPIGEFKKNTVGLQIDSEMPFPGVVFKSSGTTGEVRSMHYMRDTEHYRAAMLDGFENHWGVKASPQYRVIALTPPMENSSLYYMMQYAGEVLDQRGQVELFSDMTDPDRVLEFLTELSEPQEYPVFLFGTSLAFYDFYQSVLKINRPVIRLPEQSRLIETGGWKGRDIKMTPEALTMSISNVFFGSSEHQTLREYSMSEMSSQLYMQSQLATAYSFPGYLGVRTVDPLSQEDVGEGAEGIIGFVDLANVWSCPFVLTEDLGVLYDGTLELLGRAVSAPEKGCSLSYVEAVGS